MEKLLILGGTNFIGRRLVEKVIKRKNFDLTLFNRGLTNSSLYQDIKHLKGDRNTADINKILQKKWDYIIDLSCYFPNSIQRICEGLVSPPKRYVFVSTCSVYDNEQSVEILRSESAPILSCSTEERISEELSTYGNRKAECERILNQSELPHTIFRPALVYGKYDPTDRFYYWLYQVYQNDPLLLPEGGKRLFSTTYVEDLVQGILLSLSERENSTVYNITSTPKTSILKMVNSASKLLFKTPGLLHIQAELLNNSDISQWSGMPLWINGDHFTYNNEKLINELAFSPTPFEVSVKETIDYYHKSGWLTPKFGITEEKRKELLLLLTGN